MATDQSGGGKLQRVPCAIVLEDDPVGRDSRISFSSFQQEIEQSYQVHQYREHGARRMAQPGFLTYLGGNWGPFTLRLKFRAGDNIAAISKAPAGISNLNVPEVEQMLIAMERKVRWCEALPIPIARRSTSGETRGFLRNAPLPTSLQAAVTQSLTAAIGSLRRVEPNPVLVVFGSWMVVRGYVTGVIIRWGAPFHPVSVRPYEAEVQITVQPLWSDYPTWQAVRDQAGVGAFTVASPGINGVVVPSEVRNERQRQTQQDADLAAALAAIRSP